MNPIQNEFDIITKQYGGIYIPKNSSEDQLLLTSKNKIILFLQRIRTELPQLPEVNVDYINNSTPNACAFKSDGYNIGIFKGLVVNLNEKFSKIVDNDLFYENTNYKKENQELYKKKLLDYALKFLICHEFSHIRFGHCDLLASRNINFIFEMSSRCDSENGLFKQTLEFDADCTAAATVINRILADTNLDDLKSELTFWNFATYYLFRLLSADSDCYPNCDLDKLDTLSHPPIGIRQNYIGATLATILLKVYSEQICDIMIKDIPNILILIEKLYNGNMNPINTPIAVAYTKKGSAHNNKIQNNWKNVREKLIEFSIDNLAPVENIDFKPPTID